MCASYSCSHAWLAGLRGDWSGSTSKFGMGVGDRRRMIERWVRSVRDGNVSASSASTVEGVREYGETSRVVRGRAGKGRVGIERKDEEPTGSPARARR